MTLPEILGELYEKKHPTPVPDWTTPAPTTDALCGTISGYQTHRKLGLETCQDCRDAWNAYTKAWRKNAQ